VCLEIATFAVRGDGAWNCTHTPLLCVCAVSYMHTLPPIQLQVISRGTSSPGSAPEAHTTYLQNSVMLRGWVQAYSPVTGLPQLPSIPSNGLWAQHGL
jgi:hypothetical protein